MPDKLYVVACLANPLNWQSRYRNAERAIANWLADPHVDVTLVECIYPGQKFQLAKYEGDRVMHLPVCADTVCWQKESLLNIGIESLPDEARYVGTFDLDVLFNEPGWAASTIGQLRWKHHVVQPWFLCLYLDPNGDVLEKHQSFCSVANQKGLRVEEPFVGHWQDECGKRYYGHTGYAWAWRRDFLEELGGLFDLGALGSGDLHMAYGLIGQAHRSVRFGLTHNYRHVVEDWGARALRAGASIGYTATTINHLFHGERAKRAYKDRWTLLSGYDPLNDTAYNEFGVLELAGNKPQLAADILTYFKSRDEDYQPPQTAVA